MRDLYIIGAGGFGREVAWLVERINETEKTWNLKGFIDDDPEAIGEVAGGYPIIGTCEYLTSLKEKVWVVCAVGNTKARKVIINKFKEFPNINYATLVDPNVIYSKRVTLGVGSIICAGTILTVDIRIGNHVIINLNCTIGHDNVTGDFVTIYPGACVSGNVKIGECAELGTGMQVIQGRTIGCRSIVGAGGVVVKDIPDDCTAVGNPTRIIKVKLQ